MLNFKQEMQDIFNQVKTDYEQQPFIEIRYPPTIDKDTWEFHEDGIKLPKVNGQLYFIFDDNKNLLYIGKTKEIRLALRNHLIRHTSKSSISILDTVKEKVSNSEEKRIYIKTIELRPIELGSYLKTCLIEEYEPSLCQRLS